MNPYESEQLSRFLNQLREARVASRDTDADRLIRDAVRENPDASYLLVQRTMLLEQGLNNAKAQIAQLQQQPHRAWQSDQAGFLGRNDPWATDSRQVPHQGRVPGAAAYQVPAASPGSGTVSGGSSFLGNVASTAAGVVAGSFLFRGVEHLLSHASAAGGFHDPDVEPQAGQTLFGNEDEVNTSALWGQQDPVDDFANFGDDPFLDSPDDTSWV